MSRKLSSSQQELFQFLLLTQEKIQKPFGDIFKEKLSTMQFSTMSILKRYGLLTMGELAEKMNMPKQQMTQIVNKLVEIGFAVRHSDEHDRRIIRISTTQEGDALLRATAINFWTKRWRRSTRWASRKPSK
ncbi:MAG: MarR family transcriptional regulator [Eubacteriales bacterium]|nr:MarR family transcriptional regulator [Eubacteriales bacterium]